MAENEITFMVRIYGGQASQDIQQIRKALLKELKEAEAGLAASTERANKAITSQTRRFSTNKKRLEEVGQRVIALRMAWEQLTGTIQQESDGVFDKLIKEAEEAYNDLVGRSTFPELRDRLAQIFREINELGSHAFDDLKTAAEAAAKEAIEPIEGVKDAAGRLRWPAGTQLEGVSLGGRMASQEQIDKYNEGLLKLQDVMPGVQLTIQELHRLLGKAAPEEEQINAWNRFTEQLNLATLQFFGLRRLGYGLEQFGGQLAAAGERNIEVMRGWVDEYGSFNEAATLAAVAMEMTAEEQENLEESVLNNVEAMRLFSPEETLGGLRAWAAGTGAVVHTQEELNEILAQTRDIQVLAALGADDLESAMANVGGTLAEYGLGIREVDRVTAVYNFTAAKTFAEISDMGDAFRMVGPLAASLGVSLEETAATLGALSDENIRGTMAGRAFRQMLIQLSKPTQDHNEAMNRALGLNEKLGETWQDLVFPEGEFIGLTRYLDLLAAATENMTEAQRAQLLATIATANELPAITALVNRQIEARKEGINIIRAWTKWSVGQMDEEVMAFQDYMERVRNIEVDTSTNMYSLWENQSERFYDAESSKLRQYENEWRALQTRLGRVVFEEGAPAVERMLDLLDRLARFAAEHPALVEGAIIAAGAELVLGNLVRVAGQLLGVTANILILKTAFTGFSGSVGVFQAAVQLFSQSVGVEAATGGGAGAAAAGATALTARAIALRLLGVWGLIAGIDQPSAQQQAYEDMIEELRQFNLSAEQWTRLAQAGLGVQRAPGPGQEQRFEFRGEPVTNVEEYLRIAQELGELTQDQLRLISEWRMARTEFGPDFYAGPEDAEMSVDVQPDIPPELQQLLEEMGVNLPVQVDLFGGLTDEEMTAVDLFEEMGEKINDLEEDFRKRRADIIEDYNEREEELEADHQARMVELVEDYKERELDYYQDHLDRLEELRERYNDRVEDEIKDFERRLAEIYEDAERRKQDVIEDIQRRREEARREHLKTLARMEEDHRDTLVDLAIRRDAYGIYREMREHSKKRRREEEDYRDRLKELEEDGQRRIEEIEKQARREEKELRESHQRRLDDLKEALEEQLKEEEENYKKAAKKRKKAHEEQLREMEENFEEQRRKRQRAHEKELEDLREKFDEEEDEIRRSMLEQIAELLGYYNEELENYNQYLRDRLDALRRYLEENRELWEQEYEGGGGGGGGELPENAPGDEGVNGYAPQGVGLAPVHRLGRDRDRLDIVGKFDINITAPGGVPAASIEGVDKAVQDMFESVVRRLEVSYG